MDSLSSISNIERKESRHRSGSSVGWSKFDIIIPQPLPDAPALSLLLPRHRPHSHTHIQGQHLSPSAAKHLTPSKCLLKNTGLNQNQKSVSMTLPVKQKNASSYASGSVSEKLHPIADDYTDSIGNANGSGTANGNGNGNGRSLVRTGSGAWVSPLRSLKGHTPPPQQVT